MRETSPMRKYSLSGITGSEALLPLRCFFFSAVMTEALRAPDGRLQHWHSTTGLPALHGARTCTLVARTLTRNNSGVATESELGARWNSDLFAGGVSDHAPVSRRVVRRFAVVADRRRSYSQPFRQRKTASANSNRGGQLVAKKLARPMPRWITLFLLFLGGLFRCFLCCH